MLPWLNLENLTHDSRVHHIVVRLVWKMERPYEVDHISYICFTVDGECKYREFHIHLDDWVHDGVVG